MDIVLIVVRMGRFLRWRCGIPRGYRLLFLLLHFFTNGVCKEVELSISVVFFACTYFGGGKREQAVFQFHPMVLPMIFVFLFNVQDPNPVLEIQDATQDFISTHHVTVSRN